MKKYVPSAIAAAVLATLALPLAAQAAQATPAPAPGFVAAKYGDAYFSRDDLKDLTVGDAQTPSFGTTNVSDTFRIVDETGDTRCISTAIWCDFTDVLTVGDHSLKTVVDRDGSTVESEPLVVHVVSDSETVDPGPVDPGTGVVDAPGGVDSGFTVQVPTPGLEAPKVVLGDTLGSRQNLVVSLPATADVNDSQGHVRIVDETGTQVVDRAYDMGGSDIAIPVPGEHGAKHTYFVSVENRDGLTPKTEIVIDNENADLPPARFEDDPQVSRGTMYANVLGTPGGVATLTNVTTGEQSTEDLGEVGAAQLTAKVADGEKNVLSIVVTKGGQTSAPLTHVVDLTPAGPTPIDPAVPGEGEVDPGFTVQPPVESGDVESPRVLSAGHATVGGKHVIRLWIAPPADSSATIVIAEGDTKRELRQSPTQEYLFEIADREVAHDLTVQLKSGSKVSAPTTVHVDALG